MAPELEDYRSGATRWFNRDVAGVLIEIVHHGISSYAREGIWNFYLILDEEHFPDPQLFKQFLGTREVIKWTDVSPYRESWNYECLPDPGFHGGITFYEQRTGVRGDNGQDKIIVKIGCDYNHLWDTEADYPDTFRTVLIDAKRAAQNLLDQKFGEY